MKNIHLLTLFLCAAFSIECVAQLPYLEDFLGETDKGVVGVATYDTTGVNWTIDVSSASLTATTDYFQVIYVSSNDLFEARDTDGEVVWKSALYDIDGLGLVDLSVDLSHTSTMETADYINVYYILNGNGTEIAFSIHGENSGTFTSVTAEENALSGTSVQIVIRADNNADAEKHRFDNVSVTASSGYNTPSVGDIYITEFGRHSNSSYGYLAILNATSSNIDLSSAKIVSDGSNDEVLDFGTDIIGASYIPANGYLILNRDASQSNFESTWSTITGHTISLGSDVIYVRSGLNSFGNNNTFTIQVGGTADTDDGTLIDGSSLNATSNDKRVYQMPAGTWTDNIDDQSNATPGYLGEGEDLVNTDLVYAHGSWAGATGFADTEPSSLTGSGSAIVVDGQATFNDGSVLKSLTIMADAGTDVDTEDIVVSDEIIVNHDGALSITGTGSITCSGSITIEKTGYNSSADYNAWGTPFATAIDMGSVFTNHFNCEMYAFEASTQAWKYDETIGGSLDCNGTAYAVTAAMAISTVSSEGSPDGNFDIGRGYFIAGHATNSHEFTVASGGVLNNGDITVNIFGSSTTATDGSNDWNLISNPYPSSISVAGFLTENSGTGKIDNAVYLYNPGNGLSTATSYDTYNKTHTSNYIASGQGFYVNGNTSIDGLASTVEFNNSMRHYTNNDFRSVLSYFGVYLDVVDADGENDPTRIYFDSESEDGYDKKFDALKLPNGDFNFCSMVNDQKLVFNGYSELTNDSRIVPLYFQTNQTSVYTINLDSLVGSFTNMDVLLEDRYMRTFHNVKQSGYAFNSDPKEWANRFYLHIIPKKNSIGTGQIGVTDTTTIVTSIDAVTNENLKVFYSNDEVIVSMVSGNQNITEVQFISINGQVVLEKKVTGSVVKIATTSYPSGLYLIKTRLENNEVQLDRVVIR